MLVRPVNFKGTIEYSHKYNVVRSETRSQMQHTHFSKKAGADMYDCNCTIKPAAREKMVFCNESNCTPLDKRHFEKLLNNFYEMEKRGYYYKCLDDNHMLYGKDNSVQIGFTKDIQPFFSTNKELFIQDYQVSSMMQSNAENYEANSLASYVLGIEDEDCRFDFLKDYLKQKSDYHAKRADLLLSKGFSPSSNAVMIEDIKSLVLRYPSRSTIDFTKEKFEIYALKNKALKLWNEGGKHSDDELAPIKRFESVILQLEALKAAVLLDDKAEELIQNAVDEDRAAYFALEKKQLKSIKAEICNDAQINGDLNFCNQYFGKNGLFLGSKVNREFFNKIFDNIDLNKPSIEICKDIDTLIKFYTSLMQYWTPASNKLHSKDYSIKVIGVNH